MSRILLVDDEPSIVKIVQQVVAREGHEFEHAGDGNQALEKFDRSRPDLVILDVMLPGLDGFELCRRFRQTSQVPILILSAKSDIVDKTVGFNQGADDYLGKPFSPVELSLRIRALLRRAKDAGGRADRVVLPGLEIDGLERTVKVEGRYVDLTAKEFDLLWFLAQNAGRAFTREQLFERIWREEPVGDISTVTVFIRRLREKVEKDPGDPAF